MINNDDCFAFKKIVNLGTCRILSPADCNNCKFFKTKAEYLEGLKHVDESKFISLDESDKIREHNRKAKKVRWYKNEN